jgi:hypothetical protein
MSAPASEVAQGAQVEHVEARLLAIAASQRLVYDEIAETADFIESFAIGLREAARRGDRPRVHAYTVDIAKCDNDIRNAYGRIAALEKLGDGK